MSLHSLPRISSNMIASVTGVNPENRSETRPLNPIPGSSTRNTPREEGISPYQMPGRGEAQTQSRTNNARLRSPIFSDIERKATEENQGFISKIFGGNRVAGGNQINSNA